MERRADRVGKYLGTVTKFMTLASLNTTDQDCNNVFKQNIN